MAGNADPQTGYQVLVDGKQVVYGGTSAVAPLWAALIARLAQATGHQFGLMQPVLYSGVTPGADVAGFHDIIPATTVPTRPARLGRVHGTRLPVRHRPADQAQGLDRRRWLLLPAGPEEAAGLARVARMEPARMSANAPAMAAVRCSPSTRTPSATATAGFT